MTDKEFERLSKLILEASNYMCLEKYGLVQENLKLIQYLVGEIYTKREDEDE